MRVRIRARVRVKKAGLSTFANPLGRVHLGAVFHGVDGEVDLGKRLLLADGTDGIVDVGIARMILLLLLAAAGRVGLLISGVHVGRRWAVEAVGDAFAGRGPGLLTRARRQTLGDCLSSFFLLLLFLLFLLFFFFVVSMLLLMLISDALERRLL